MKADSVRLNDMEMYYETDGAGEPLLLLTAVPAGVRVHFVRATRHINQ